MKLVYLGSGPFGLPALDAIKRSRHQLTLVVTQPAKPAGRGRTTKPTAVAQWASENGIPCLETANINDEASFTRIKAENADLIVVIAFGQKIGNPLIELPPKGMINVHGSLVPHYRGAGPINWPIINGDKQTGISIITVVEKMDAGDMIASADTDIGELETAGELYDRLAELSAPVLIKAIDQIEAGTAAYTPQDDSKATKAPKLKKEHGFLDFSKPADHLQCLIRGLAPWPGAVAVYHSEKTGKSCPVTIGRARVVPNENPQNLPPGTLDDDLNIICGENSLEILEIKPAGSPMMDFKSFVNGRQTKPGDTFTRIEQ